MNCILLVTFSSLLLSSCHVKNQLYNRTPKSIISVPHSEDGKDCDLKTTACLAFIEFDDMGEFWERDKSPGEPLQLTAALDLMRRAKKADTQAPIIVTFTHGWKNNAGLQNANVAGFEGVLQYIRDKYKRPVVGIYIGWRGDLISKYWPISRQLTYFNREGAAIRIPGASMTEAFTRIMIEAHHNSPGTQLIMVGHSFGGLVLERALTQAVTAYVIRGTGTGTVNRQHDAEESRIWADLVVFVNSAAAASEGKQLLNFLKERAASYTSKIYGAADEYKRTQERPLLVSISSIGDSATRFLLPIGHGPSYINRALNGSWRTYAPADPPEVTSQSSYYLSTTAHMPVLQSHVIVEIKKGGPVSDCPAPYATPFPVTTGQTYQVCEKPKRWNDTPYWAMEMPTTIVPDHNGIFNENFIALLTQFLPSKEEMDDERLRPIPATKSPAQAK
jgi:hypothetical protein